MSVDGVTGAEGRPGPGAVLAADLDAATQKRARRRDLAPLAGLRPFLRAHWGDAALAGLFLTLSTSATLGATFAARALADLGFASHSAGAIGRYFLVLAGVLALLALATAGRFYFISKLGERVVADIRVALYANVMTLDQAYFLKVRTGEVLSRMTTDLTIVENMVGASVSVALRNLPDRGRAP